MRTITLLILGLTASSVMSACAGPNFISDFYNFPVIAAADTPNKATVDNTFGVCGFANAADICCSKATLDTFQDRVDDFRETLEALAGDRDKFLIEQRGEVLKVRDSLNKLNEISESDNAALSAYVDYISGLEGFTEIFAQNFTGLVNNFAEFQKARVTCMEKLITAQVSVWCSACSFDFANEAGVDETNEDVTFDDALVTELSGACWDYFAFSANQSAIISLSTVGETLTNLASGLEKLINGDTSGATDDLTKAVTALLAVTNSDDAFEKPSKLPATCTKTSCPWIETTLFTDGLQLVNNTAVMGGDEAIFGFTGSQRVLKERKLAGTGFAPDLSAIEVTIGFAENPGNVDNTQNASAFRNGIVACAVAAFALVF